MDLSEIAKKFTINTVVQRVKHFYPEYKRRFESGISDGEYYGRGNLEGFATAVWPFITFFGAQKELKEQLTGEEWAWLEVQGESADADLYQEAAHD